MDEEGIKIDSSSEKESPGAIKGWLFLSQEQNNHRAWHMISVQ